MDSGMLSPGEKLEEDYDLGRELSPKEVLGIMDQLMCYEAAWHQGNSLSQTLFTSLHLVHLLDQKRPKDSIPSFPPRAPDQEDDPPHSMLHGVLRAYCIGLIKCIDIVAEMMVSQQYYEEEDFNTNTYNKDLLTNMADQKAIALLYEAISWLRTMNGVNGHGTSKQYI